MLQHFDIKEDSTDHLDMVVCSNQEASSLVAAVDGLNFSFYEYHLQLQHSLCPRQFPHTQRIVHLPGRPGEFV